MAWIMTIARNLALMRLRRQQRAGDLTEEEWMALPDEGRGLKPRRADAAAQRCGGIVRTGAADRSSLCRHRLEAPEIAALLQMPFAHGLVQISPRAEKIKNALEREDAL